MYAFFQKSILLLPMLKIYFLTLVYVLIAFASPAQDIKGAWGGVLKVQGAELRIVFNITQAVYLYSATMDSPDQNAFGLPTSSVSFEKNILKIEAKNLYISYEGTYNGEKFVGKFTQAGQEFPLTLSRQSGTTPAKKLLRPQEPKEPFAYYVENVTFENKQAGFTLSGTLTLPKKEGKFPVVVLISGSGGQDRNQEILGHKSFWVLADHLTKQGIGVLRYDDRGVGESKGVFATATSEDFARDVESALAYLKTRPDINPKKMGLIGHSEGGMIAPMVASRNKDVSFMVLLAGTGVRGAEVLLAQQDLIAKADGMPQAEIDKNHQFNQKLFETVLENTDSEVMKTKLTALLQASLPTVMPTLKPEQYEAFIKQQITAIDTPWMLFFLRYNPATALSKVKCPVLAVNGSKDLQVPPKQNLDAIQQALQKAGNKKATIKELPNLNHLFQECSTGSPKEYAKIEQTLSPTLLDEVTTWLLKQTK